MNLLLVVRDPEGSMQKQTERVIEKWQGLFSKSVISHTKDTDAEFVKYLDGQGMRMIVGGLWGEARRQGVKYLVESGSEENVLVMDFDKLIHVLEFYFEEFKNFLGQSWTKNTLIGRTQKAWDTFPVSWRETEAIANKLGNRKFQTNNRDYMLGMFVLDATGQRNVAEKSRLLGFDSMFEWVNILGRESLNYKDSDIFDWEDPDRNQADIQRLGREMWEKERFDGIEEWKKRIFNLQQLVSSL